MKIILCLFFIFATTLYGQYVIESEESEITEFRNGAVSALAFGFDDGNISVAVDTILRNRGLRCYFSLNSGWSQVYNNWPIWNQMFDNGHEIVSHGKNHLTPVSPDYLDDIYNGIIELEANIDGLNLLTHFNASSAGNADGRAIMLANGIVTMDQQTGYVIGYEGFTYTTLLSNMERDPGPMWGISRQGADTRDLTWLQNWITTNCINKSAFNNLFWHYLNTSGITETTFRGLCDWLVTQQNSGTIWASGRFADVSNYMYERVNSTVY
jgi:hypothetical protein